MRYFIALGIAILAVAMMWPYLRQYASRRQAGEPTPPSKSELIYLAIVVTLVLSFTISTLLWVFGK